MNISNYGVKKMLPRLIVAAIVVNISYYLCQIAVDISNIVGTSIYEMLINMKVGTGATADVNSLEDALTLSGTGNWESIVGGLLAGVAGVVLVVAICLAPMVLLSFLVILLILVARQALVIILIVISPLAFVAYILPNTEQLFKRWWKMFVATLVVFPVVGLVFGASALTSKILLEVAAGGNNEGDDKQMLALIAMAVAAIPLFAVPSILKGSLNAAGAIGAKLSGLSDMATGAAKKQYSASSYAQGRALRKQGKEEFKRRKFAGAVSGNDSSLLGRTRRRMAMGPITGGRTIRPNGAAAFASDNMIDTASAKVASAEAEALKSRTAILKGSALSRNNDGIPDSISSYSTHGGSVGHLQAEFHKAISSGDSIQAQAALQALKESGDGGVEAIQETLNHHEKDGGFRGETKSALRSFINNSHNDLKNNDSRITNWAGSDDAGAASAILNTDLSGLSNQQIATQTNAALSQAHTNGQLTGRKKDVKAGIESGTISTKTSKYETYFK